jgi:acyl carrier protein
MTRAEIYNRVVGILIKSFELDPADIKPESRLFEDLDLDSIDAVDMFVELHEVTNRRIDPQVARKIRTVEDIVNLVEGELHGTPPAPPPTTRTTRPPPTTRTTSPTTRTRDRRLSRPAGPPPAPPADDPHRRARALRRA